MVLDAKWHLAAYYLLFNNLFMLFPRPVHPATLINTSRNS
jgi:hypothetical protein